MKLKVKTFVKVAPEAEKAVHLEVTLPPSEGVVVAYDDPVEALNDACEFVTQALNAVRRAALQ